MIRVIGLAFSALMFAIYMINIKWGWDVTKWSQTMGMSKDESGEISVQPMPENPFMNLLESMKPDPAAFRTQSSGEATQKVLVSRMIKFDDILADGEKSPDPALQAVYVEARAPQLLSGLCDDVIQTVGTKCRVLESSSSSREEGYFQVRGALTYLAVTQQAQPANTRELQTNAIRVSAKLTPHGSSKEVKDSPLERQRYLAKADRICAEIRATFGNCTLSGVTLTSDVQRKKNKKKRFSSVARPTLSVSMQVKVQNQLPNDRPKIQAFLERQAELIN